MKTLTQLVISVLSVLPLGLLAPFHEAKAQAESETLEAVRCPKIIAFPDWGQYTAARRNKNIVCLDNRKQAKQNFTRCRKDCGPGFGVETETFFSMSENGPANSPAFTIRRRSAQLFYDYQGKDGLLIELIDFQSGKPVDKLVRVRRGPVSGSTFIHDRGTFYLKITPGESEESSSWEVDFEIPGTE